MSSEAQDSESQQLWKRFATDREPAVRARLIEDHLPLARAIAVKIYRMRSDNSVSFNDYLQYARVGLLEAVDRYEPEREISFYTFSAYRIRGAILNGLAGETEAAAMRRHRQRIAQARLISLKTENSTQAENSLMELAHLAADLAIVFMLEQRCDEVDESPQANPYAATELVELKTVVDALVKRLPDRERQLVQMHYYAQKELQDIARHLGVTKGRVSQLHGQAIARIRKLLDAPASVDREA